MIAEVKTIKLKNTHLKIHAQNITYHHEEAMNLRTLDLKTPKEQVKGSASLRNDMYKTIKMLHRPDKKTSLYAIHSSERYV